MTHKKNVGEYNEAYIPWAFAIAKCSAATANYCDHVEHAEEARAEVVEESGRQLRRVALEVADYENEDLVELYAKRLDVIEKRSWMRLSDSPDMSNLARRAKSWRDLQRVQILHDFYYHPDIRGLAKINQLRHHSLHLAKLAGALVGQADQTEPKEDFVKRRLPDIALFGIIIANLVPEELSKKPF